jgi:phage gpG-like protein
MPPFVPAAELNRGFYADVVGPLLAPWPHSAALIGWGSQVLGYDTERSTDHGWGPRIKILVATDAEIAPAQAAIDDALPDEYNGWAVAFGWDDTPVTHHVRVTTPARWFARHLGFDPCAPIATLDWLTTPQELFLELTSGAMYHEGLDVLGRAQAAVAYFPADVHHWLLACQWQRLSQEEPFVGRTAEVGDEIGSRLLAARQVQILMQLHFLYAHKYWPYSKWFGSAYARLPGSDTLLPCYAAIIEATTFAAREAALVGAWEQLAAMHNASGLPAVDDPRVRPFHTRPFRVLDSNRFVDAIRSTIDDEWLRALPLVGSVDQVTDSTDVKSYAAVAHRLRGLYEQT